MDKSQELIVEGIPDMKEHDRTWCYIHFVIPHDAKRCFKEHNPDMYPTPYCKNCSYEKACQLMKKHEGEINI